MSLLKVKLQVRDETTLHVLLPHYHIYLCSPNYSLSPGFDNSMLVKAPIPGRTDLCSRCSTSGPICHAVTRGWDTPAYATTVPHSPCIRQKLAGSSRGLTLMGDFPLERYRQRQSERMRGWEWKKHSSQQLSSNDTDVCGHAPLQQEAFNFCFRHSDSPIFPL